MYPALDLQKVEERCKWHFQLMIFTYFLLLLLILSITTLTREFN